MKWVQHIVETLSQDDPARDLSALPPLVRLGRISLLMSERQKNVLKPFGLTPSEYSILGSLRRAGGARLLKPGDLYNVVGCSPGGLTKMIDRLEQRGLVRRAADAADGRCAPLRLTAKGTALEKAALEAYVESADELMDALPKSELARIDAALEVLLDCFEPEEDAPRIARRASGRSR
ncbi:MAG: MarR family transcriptional regulator [Deltaproteobacteria bacterium]|nr:MarR family transcriptional regulator [Deltaproteobacteria bacterium]